MWTYKVSRGHIITTRGPHYDTDMTMGVTRLDGARGKKQVWRPHVRS